jgi:FixJ family two-component response regulator
VATSNEFNEARLEIRVGEPDVVVVDIRLGEFNGIQLGMLAKQVNADAQVVVMSGWNDPVLRREAALLGARFVQKPFRSDDLLGAIEES